MSPEIPQRFVAQKLVEFIRTDPEKGINVFPLVGGSGRVAKIDAVAGYFNQVSRIPAPVFGIYTDEKGVDPFSFIPTLNRLVLPPGYDEGSFARPDFREKYSAKFTRNGLPIIAVILGRIRDSHGKVTPEPMAQLYAIWGMSPQQALRDIQRISSAYRPQNN
jgi:hypothetical protein